MAKNNEPTTQNETNAKSEADTIKKINARFHNALVSWRLAPQFITEDYAHDDYIFGEIADAPRDSKRRPLETENQRVLLEVEKARQREAQRKKAAEIELLDKVSRLINNRARKELISRINSAEKVLSGLRLTGNLPVTIEMMQDLFSPSSTYKSLNSAIAHHNDLAKHFIRTVSTDKFARSVGKKPRKIKDIHQATGFVGLEMLKVLIPMMMAKLRIRFHDHYFKMLPKKLWQYLIVHANTCVHLLEKEGHREPLDGILISLLSNMGYIAVASQYEFIWDEIKQNTMSQLRKKNMMDKYFKSMNVKPDGRIIASVFHYQHLKTIQNITQEIPWKRMIHLRNGLQEHAEQTPVKQRSRHGRILAQADTYARFEMLNDSKLFQVDDLKLWMAQADFNPAIFKKLVVKDLKRFDLIKFTE